MNNFANREIHQQLSLKPVEGVDHHHVNQTWGQASSGLLAAKQKYDPENFFSFPQMIAPYPDGRASTPVWPPKVAKR